jgi:uncharacterized protein (DUF1800 family)
MTNQLRHLPRLAAAAMMTAAAFLTLSAQGAMPAGSSAIPAQPDDATVAHVLSRLGYGARPGDVATVKAMGLSAYIEQQLHPAGIADAIVTQRLAGFPTIVMTTAELWRDHFGPAEAARQAAQRAAGQNGAPATPPARPAQQGMQQGGDMQMMTPPQPAQPQRTPEQQAVQQKAQQVLNDLMQAKLVRATMSERQLEEVLVDFWFNHFNVFSGKGEVRTYITEYERDVIRPHVLGSFRDLLGAVAESPAMLFYLDNFQNVDPKAAQRQADQLAQVQQRAGARGRAAARQTTQQREQQEQRMQQIRNRGLNENYARELMELHTLGVDGGYTQADVIAVARAFTEWTIDRPRQGGAFQFNAPMHDNDPKVVLGKTISAGGKKDGEAVLDLLATHPATATFIATKLARRFVSDEPPKALVDRVAKVFLATKGDLRAVTRAIVTSPEFFAPETRHAKVKTPFEFVVSSVRASGTTIVTVAPLVQALRTLGQPLYGAQPPTGYGDTAEDWVSTGALLNRMNFAVQLASNQLRGLRLNVRSLAADTSDASRAAVVTRLVGTDISPITRDTLAKAQSPQHLVALTLGSPEFQKR